jgi:hypothetical protein
MKTVINLFSAFLTPTISIVVAYIAYQQYRTNKLALKIKTYDRGSKIYGAVKKFIGIALRNGTITDNNLYDFWADAPEGNFLFGDEIGDYVEELYKKGMELQRFSAYLRDDNGSNVAARENVLKSNDVCFKWFETQYNVAKQKFEKYLALK